MVVPDGGHHVVVSGGRHREDVLVAGEEALEAGGGLEIADDELTVDSLLATVVPIVTDSDALSTMSRAAASRGTRGATEKLVDMTIRAAGG